MTFSWDMFNTMGIWGVRAFELITKIQTQMKYYQQNKAKSSDCSEKLYTVEINNLTAKNILFDFVHYSLSRDSRTRVSL